MRYVGRWAVVLWLLWFGWVVAEPLSLLADRLHVQVQATDAPVHVQTHFGTITGEVPRVDQVQRFTSLLSDEFGLYPASLLQASHLQGIVLCHHLAFAGQTRQAVPDFQHHVLYLEADPGDRLSYYQRLTIHHEFFHVVDNEQDTLYRDEAWMKLNPPGFEYGLGGKSFRDGEAGDFHPFGFISTYAQSAPEEDKAETFAYLMVRYGTIMRRAVRDPVLAAKVAAMKSRLQQLAPQMDDSYWYRLARTPVVITQGSRRWP
ncbi:MAG TPA: putative zinc-binding metallopeptidase [Candidatus Xenobia bacterium]|jgi:hypothetical protein